MGSFLEHPITALVVSVLFGALAMNGRLSRGISACLFVLAGIIGLYGVYEATGYPLWIRIPFGALFVVLVVWLAWWGLRRNESGRPRIMLTAQDGEPFRLVHLGGGAAQHVQVEPIQSALGKNIWVRFGAVDFLSLAKPEVYPSFRLYIHGIAKENSDMGLLGAGLFSGDAVGRSTVDYPITISFHWNGKRLKERQTLTWHYATKTLTSGSAK
jgi:hypothetical protein